MLGVATVSATTSANSCSFDPKYRLISIAVTPAPFPISRTPAPSYPPRAKARRGRGRGEGVVSDIEAKGGQAAVALGGLMTVDGVEAVIKATEQAFDGVDILVNNAGGSNSATASGWFETPVEEWTESYRQNALPTVRLAQAFVPAMPQRGWGRLIQSSSRNALSAYPPFGPYGPANPAVTHL